MLSILDLTDHSKEKEKKGGKRGGDAQWYNTIFTYRDKNRVGGTVYISSKEKSVGIARIRIPLSSLLLQNKLDDPELPDTIVLQYRS
jgi:hypothetical protein